MKYCRAIVVISVILSSAVAAWAQPAATAWVVNTLGETLSRIDLSTGQVEVNALTLGSAPNDIVIAGATGYVVNSLSQNVQIIDLDNQQTSGTIEIYLGLNPWSIALDENNKAFVSNWLTGNVSVLDLASGNEINALDVGGAPEGICVFENSLFVADVNFDMSSGTFGQGRLHAFSWPDLTFRGTVNVGINPQAVKPGPDGLLHVVCTGNYAEISGQIDLVNAAALQVESSIVIGGSPGSLTFTADNIAYLGAGGWEGQGLVLSYDAISHQILHSAQNPILVPSAAMGVCATQDEHVLVCCFATDQLVELDNSGNQLRSFQVGYAPIAVAVWEPPLYVTAEAVARAGSDLVRIYPEPFNAATTILFHNDGPQPFVFKVFNQAGRLLRNQYLGELPAGQNRVLFIPDPALSSGPLWFRLESPAALITGKMIYLK